METLYKYLSEERLSDLLERSRIRVGTLYEYRNTREHPREVADGKEGRRQIVVDVAAGDRQADVHEQVERTIEHYDLDHDEDTEVTVVARNGDNVVVEACSPNLYLFSASQRCDNDLLHTMRYDACVCITQPARFFAALTRAMNNVRDFLGYRQVIYEDPRQPCLREGVHPAFFKGADYSHQAEVRALWEPQEHEIESVVVQCAEAASLCRLSLSRRRW